MHAHNPCAGCGAKPKARQAAYTRHSPDAVTISQYLTERTGFDVNLTPTDTVCKACYDMHLVVMQHIESQASAPHIQLLSDIKLWSMKMCDDNTNELTRAVLATVIFVAKKLQQDRALLPHVVTVFLDHYCQARDNGHMPYGLYSCHSGGCTPQVWGTDCHVRSVTNNVRQLPFSYVYDMYCTASHLARILTLLLFFYLFVSFFIPFHFLFQRSCRLSEHKPTTLTAIQRRLLLHYK